LEEAGDQADLIFLAAEKTSNLAQLRRLAPRLKPNGALWVVYPKGVTDIREIEVIEAGRKAQLKDVKVASFSLTHTGLKFVIPVARRPASR
jgi:predicted O-methyltransferase YrrM